MLGFLKTIVNAALNYAESTLSEPTTQPSQTEAPPMIYDGKPFYTIGDFVNYAIRLGNTDMEKAQDFFKEYIKWIYDVSLPRVSMEMAREIAVSNFKRRAWQNNAEIYDILMNVIRPYNQ